MNILTLLLFFSAFTAFAQTDSTFKENTNIFPIWTFHDDSVNIHGVSIGIGTVNDKRFTNTNGIKIELIGTGLFLLLASQSPAASDDSSYLQMKSRPISEKINGISISPLGTTCNCMINGLSANYIGTYNFQVNGISGAIAFNSAQIHNGIQIGGYVFTYKMNGLQIGFAGNKAVEANGVQIGTFGNRTDRMRGIQIGIYNYAEFLKGIQIGIWNINQNRSLPILNWSF